MRHSMSLFFLTANQQQIRCLQKRKVQGTQLFTSGGIKTGKEMHNHEWNGKMQHSVFDRILRNKSIGLTL